MTNPQFHSNTPHRAFAAMISLLFLAAASTGQAREARDLRIDNPDAYWRDGRFVNLVPSIHVPQVHGSGDSTVVQVWMRLPDDAGIVVRFRPGDGKTMLVLPEGTPVDRVEYRAAISESRSRARPTDASGLYTVLAVLRDHVGVSQQGLADINDDDPFVEVCCANAPVHLEIGAEDTEQRFVYPGGVAPGLCRGIWRLHSRWRGYPVTGSDPAVPRTRSGTTSGLPQVARFTGGKRTCLPDSGAQWSSP